jgi:hypothetical protein
VCDLDGLLDGRGRGVGPDPVERRGDRQLEFAPALARDQEWFLDPDLRQELGK